METDFTVDLDPGWEARMQEVRRLLSMNPVLQHHVGRWMGELIYISWCDQAPPTSEHRQAFLTDDPKLKKRIRSIGEEVYAKGGFGMMQYVHGCVAIACRGPHDARTLEYAWDGIGEWKA